MNQKEQLDAKVSKQIARFESTLINYANWAAETFYFCADRMHHPSGFTCYNHACILLQANLEVGGVQKLRYGTPAP